MPICSASYSQLIFFTASHANSVRLAWQPDARVCSSISMSLCDQVFRQVHLSALRLLLVPAIVEAFFDGAIATPTSGILQAKLA